MCNKLSLFLGETFENDRISDYGWRAIGEQVSHSPPISSMVNKKK